jgi:hypothetical protein
MVLGLNVLTRRFPVLEIADVDITRAFGKYLMKRSILEPERKMANRVPRLKIEALAANNASHGSWGDK